MKINDINLLLSSNFLFSHVVRCVDPIALVYKYAEFEDIFLFLNYDESLDDNQDIINFSVYKQKMGDISKFITDDFENFNFDIIKKKIYSFKNMTLN